MRKYQPYNQKIKKGGLLMIELRVLKAAHGDCLWVRYGEGGMCTNIIIDSGPPVFYREFKDLINRIKARNESVDLLVITHVDDDHLGGFSHWVTLEENDTSIVKALWFNTGNQIKGHLNNQKFEDKEFSIRFTKHAPEYTVQMGIEALQCIIKRGINIMPIVRAGYTININGAEISVLSPSDSDLERLLEEWEKYSDDLSFSSTASYADDLNSLMKNDRFVSDTNPYNRSSISFIFEYEGNKIAFLGDAHVSTILKEKDKLFGSDPLSVTAMKLSHHGSSGNTNIKLLESIKTNNYIVSTNGSRGNPDKKTIARLLRSNNMGDVNLYSNYDWWSNKCIFTKSDFDEYINSKKLRRIQLSEELVCIVEGVEIGNG